MSEARHERQTSVVWKVEAVPLSWHVRLVVSGTDGNGKVLCSDYSFPF